MSPTSPAILSTKVACTKAVVPFLVRPAMGTQQPMGYILSCMAAAVLTAEGGKTDDRQRGVFPFYPTIYGLSELFACLCGYDEFPTFRSQAFSLGFVLHGVTEPFHSRRLRAPSVGCTSRWGAVFHSNSSKHGGTESEIGFGLHGMRSSCFSCFPHTLCNISQPHRLSS